MDRIDQGHVHVTPVTEPDHLARRQVHGVDDQRDGQLMPMLGREKALDKMPEPVTPKHAWGSNPVNPDHAAVYSHDVASPEASGVLLHFLEGSPPGKGGPYYRPGTRTDDPGHGDLSLLDRLPGPDMRKPLGRATTHDDPGSRVEPSPFPRHPFRVHHRLDHA